VSAKKFNALLRPALLHAPLVLLATLLIGLLTVLWTLVLAAPCGSIRTFEPASPLSVPDKSQCLAWLLKIAQRTLTVPTCRLNNWLRWTPPPAARSCVFKSLARAAPFQLSPRCCLQASDSHARTARIPRTARAAPTTKDRLCALRHLPTPRALLCNVTGQQLLHARQIPATIALSKSPRATALSFHPQVADSP